MSGPVVLTGATGFVGRAVAADLAARGVPLQLVLRPGRREALPDALKGAEVVETPDLFAEDANWWAETCAGAGMVLHLAWHVDPRDYLTSARNFDCLAGTLTLARGAVQAGVPRFVGVGTCFEYRLDAEDLDPQSTPLVPLTPYAAAKIAAFQCLDQWFQQTETSFLWARLFYLYGEGEPPARLIPFIHQCLKAGEQVPLSSGRQIRDFMDTRDAAALLNEAALSRTTGAFNVCSGRGETVREIAERIADGYGRRDLLQFGARPDKLVDPPRVVGRPTPIIYDDAR